MAEKRGTPETPQNAEPEAASGPRRKKRTAPTIDLTATEVPAAEAAAAKSDPPPAETERAQTASNSEASSEQPAAQESPQPAQPEARPRTYLVALAAGAAGAAVTAGIIAAVWFTDLLPIRGPTADSPQIASLARKVQELQDRPQPAIYTKALEALGQRVSKIEQTIANLPAGDAGVGDRLSAAENAMKSLGVALTALNRRSDDVAANAAQARDRADQAVTAVDELRASIQDVTKNAGSSISDADLQDLRQRLTALEQSAKVARDDILKASSADNAARLALSAAALRDAVVSGAAFTAELAQAKSLGADEKKLAPLQSFAQGGLPSAAALAQELRAQLPEMIKVAGVQTPQGDFLDRLQANAGKLVRIRPIDAPPGDDASTVLARIEIELDKPDISAVLTDLGKLPDAVRAPAQGWIAKAQAREAALKAARQYAADTARALGSR